MSENNNNSNRKNVTGSYPGVTGSYKPRSSAFDDIKNSKNTDAAQSGDTVRISVPSDAVKKEPKIQTPTKSEKVRKAVKEQKQFDWKLWFSNANVKKFLTQLRFYGLIVLAAILLTAGIVNVANDVFSFIKPDESIVVVIPEGGSTEVIAKELKTSGIIKHPFVFRVYCKLKKAEGKFQYGDYYLNSAYSYDQIISALKKSSVQAETLKFTIPEGSTQDDIVKILTAGKFTNITDLEHAMNSYNYKEFEFIKDLPERRCRLEGYLPAGEYEIQKGESAVSIVSKMLTRFKETFLTEENQALIQKTGKTLDELVITASLVEAECENPADYKDVASVLANRLSLQTENYLMLTSPINYVLPERKQILTETEKNTESTYNTYLYAGLPTGPVCTPPTDAFLAVIDPVSTGYMYFVSDGDKTTFSTTPEEHAAALTKAPKTAKGTDVIR